MRTDQHIIDRLRELVADGESLLAATRKRGFVDWVDADAAPELYEKGLNIIGLAFGVDTDRYDRFRRLTASGSELATHARQAVAHLRAALSDYEGGYVRSLRRLLHAEVSGDFLDQAETLLRSGYRGPAAVMAGCVLEDALRQLCDLHAADQMIQDMRAPFDAKGRKPTLEPMNVALVKAGVYNGVTQKQVTHLAGLRNKAAHGEWTAFGRDDVERMVRDVRAFVEKHIR